MWTDRGYRLAAVACLFAALIGAGAPLAAQSASPSATEKVSDDGALQSRIANLERLIEHSSGAQRVTASGSAKAAGRQNVARELLARAVEQRRSGDAAASSRLLDEATREMMQAVRLAGRPAALDEKKRRDFHRHVESIAALLDALQRIAQEKGAQEMTARVTADVDALLAEARALEAGGRLDEGMRTLTVAYDMAKGAIEELRGGDTLVRSLEFASKEEEYRYELDRNDTHRMLITLLVEEKRAAKNVDEMVGRYVARANKLRIQAEDLAGGGDYANAVTTLEQSTKELVRAIRSAGIYIPG